MHCQQHFQLDIHTFRNQPQTRFSIAVLASVVAKSRRLEPALLRIGSDLRECPALSLPGRQNHDNTSDI